jgi:hypothetical protein
MDWQLSPEFTVAVFPDKQTSFGGISADGTPSGSASVSFKGQGWTFVG